MSQTAKKKTFNLLPFCSILLIHFSHLFLLYSMRLLLIEDIEEKKWVDLFSVCAKNFATNPFRLFLAVHNSI